MTFLLGKRAQAGVTKRDIVFLVLGVCLLTVVGLKLFGAGETQRTWTCKHRLHVLGTAFTQYANDNNRLLPPAVVETHASIITWDIALTRYVANASEPSGQLPQAKDKVARVLCCPSDTEPRGGALPRSYSMPLYDIKKEGWPVQPDSAGGLGLYLDEERLKRARDNMPIGSGESTPGIRITTVPNPVWTALLVERPAIRNVSRSPELATTASPREQWSAKTIALEKFHRGKLNYLMLDTHVERLTIRQSGGHAGNGGVWTIRPWD